MTNAPQISAHLADQGIAARHLNATQDLLARQARADSRLAALPGLRRLQRAITIVFWRSHPSR